MSDAPTSIGLEIRVSRGTGTGRTRLAAFDAALRDAGVSDFNLIQLSSVVPAGSTVKEVAGADQLSGAHGDRLYCVYAAAYASAPGDEPAWAGLGWSERDDGSGEGLFVEQVGSSAEQVLTNLSATLDDLSRGRGNRFRPTGSMLSRADYVDDPVCAVVVASYLVRGWQG